MSDLYTAGARRALDRAARRARRRGGDHVEPADLLAALADEAESRAAELLARAGLDPDRLFAALGVAALPEDEANAGADTPPAPSHARDLHAVLSEATRQAHAVDRNRPVATEHLLGGLLATPGAAADLLAGAGLEPDAILDDLAAPVAAETAPLPLDEAIPPLDLAGPGEAVDLARILDASANRAREGLRVVEDYVRFALDDAALTRRLKDVRHRLADALRGLPVADLLAARDTRGDVGTHITVPSEGIRENPRAVLAANFKRTGEALRSLEEYAKLVDTWLPGRFEVLRYDVYTLEKLVLTAAAAHETLGDARLYVLVGGLPTPGDLRFVVEEALAGGAQVIQLREKGLSDRELLRRARDVRIMTAQARARFLLNDRPDLARLAGADGVHLGQDDLAPRDARRILGPKPILGVSTHEPAQLEQALLDGASYLGVGPVFPGETKDFDAYAGLAYVRQAAERTTLPWFAIGGITEANLDEVLDAGATRVAVSAAVVRAPSPRRAAAALRARLDALA
jgi:thiamine-phosphate pyrophosphorylase